MLTITGISNEINQTYMQYMKYIKYCTDKSLLVNFKCRKN